MRFLIITGMSGAGKTTALKVLEDIGYFCIDNLPVSLMISFARLIHSPGSDMDKVAVGIDIRNGQALDQLEDTFSQLQHLQIPYEILYLDSSTEVLVQRFKESRRSHPLSQQSRIEESIARERHKIAFLKERADYIVNTSNLLTRQLRAQLEKIFVMDSHFQNLMVTVVSFGYKYGLPADADLVFDVRFLPNPYYVPELKHKTGNDREVQDFLTASGSYGPFLRKLFDLIDFLIPNYIEEGKTSLVIALGCTGGRHRSVTLANALYDHLRGMSGIGVGIEHQDIEKD